MSDETRSDRIDSFSAESSMREGDKSMLVSLTPGKVRLGAWFCESFTFARRYFWRLFLLAFVLSLLFLGLTPVGYFRMSCSGGSCSVVRNFDFAPRVNPLYAESAPAGEEIAPESSDGENGGENSAWSNTEESSENAGETAPAEPSAVSPAENGEETAAPAPADSETASADSADSPASRPHYRPLPARRRAESRFSPFLTLYTARLFSFAFLIVLFAWMILGWGLRTVRQDDGSWKNLLFPTRFTLLKLIGVSFFVSVLCRLVRLAVFGPLVFVCDTLAIIAAMIILPFLYAKLGLSWHLVLDRDFGPVRAIKTSWKLTRGNTLVLVIGSGSVLLAFLACFWCVSQLSFCFFSSWYGKALLDRLGVPLSLCLLRRLNSPVYVLVGTAAVMAVVSASAVFYLTVTRQPRLGAARRETDR